MIREAVFRSFSRVSGVVARHSNGNPVWRWARRGADYLALTAIAAWSVLGAQAQSPIQPGKPPAVQILQPPDFAGASAIWGSTGADRSGHIYFGLTSDDSG